MQEVQQSKERTLVSNRTLAEQNLELQPQLERQKEQLTRRYRSLQESFESFQLRKSTLGRCLPPLDTLRTGSAVCVRRLRKSSDLVWSYRLRITSLERSLQHQASN